MPWNSANSKYVSFHTYNAHSFESSPSRMRTKYALLNSTFLSIVHKLSKLNDGHINYFILFRLLILRCAPWYDAFIFSHFQICIGSHMRYSQLDIEIFRNWRRFSFIVWQFLLCLSLTYIAIARACTSVCVCAPLVYNKNSVR